MKKKLFEEFSYMFVWLFRLKCYIIKSFVMEILTFEYKHFSEMFEKVNHKMFVIIITLPWYTDDEVRKSKPASGIDVLI